MEIIVSINEADILTARLRAEMLREKRGFLSPEEMREAAEIIRDWVVSDWDPHELTTFDDSVVETFRRTVNEDDPEPLKMALWCALIAGVTERELEAVGDVPPSFQPVLDAKAAWFRDCSKDRWFADLNFSGVVAFALTGASQKEWV